jgi:hypothetical protein
VTFASVAVDPVAGTVAWPNGIDLDPDTLHGDVRHNGESQGWFHM